MKMQCAGLPDPSWRIRVDDAVRARFPGFRLRVVLAFGLRNGASDDSSRALLADSVARLRAGLRGRPAEHPHIAAWRAAYQAFGAKPSRYPCSAESLMQRALKPGPHGSVPAINRLVDAYNAVSLGHALPVGGEDFDRLRGDLVLRFATGREGFDLPEADGSAAGAEPGEVVWADDEGVTCRRWNWRQGRRTRLGEETVNAHFILEAICPPYREAELDAAAERLSALLGELGGASRLLTLRPF